MGQAPIAGSRGHEVEESSIFPCIAWMSGSDMVRRLRIEFVGALYHVTSPGGGRLVAWGAERTATSSRTDGRGVLGFVRLPQLCDA